MSDNNVIIETYKEVVCRGISRSILSYNKVVTFLPLPYTGFCQAFFFFLLPFLLLFLSAFFSHTQTRSHGHITMSASHKVIRRSNKATHHCHYHCPPSLPPQPSSSSPLLRSCCCLHRLLSSRPRRRGRLPAHSTPHTSLPLPACQPLQIPGLSACCHASHRGSAFPSIIPACQAMPLKLPLPGSALLSRLTPASPSLRLASTTHGSSAPLNCPATATAVTASPACPPARHAAVTSHLAAGRQAAACHHRQLSWEGPPAMSSPSPVAVAVAVVVAYRCLPPPSPASPPPNTVTTVTPPGRRPVSLVGSRLLTACHCQLLPAFHWLAGFPAHTLQLPLPAFSSSHCLSRLSPPPFSSLTTTAGLLAVTVMSSHNYMPTMLPPPTG